MRRLTIVLTPYEAKRIEELVRETGLTYSDLVRRILDEYLGIDPLKERRDEAVRSGSYVSEG